MILAWVCNIPPLSLHRIIPGSLVWKLCMARRAVIELGKVAPGFAKYLDGLAIYVGEAPVVSIPIAICPFFMMYPISIFFLGTVSLAFIGTEAVDL